MDEKTLNTLEFLKILDRLAGYAAFGISADLARSLRPSNDLDEVTQRQTRTSEARRLLEVYDTFSIGGARDIRDRVDLARRAGVLEPTELLDIKGTLISAREIARIFDRHGDQYPTLAAIAAALPPPPGMIEAISRAISDRGEVLDQASERLARIRREMKIAHERLLTRLERLINDPKHSPMLQELIITQRSGRYVVPLRAEYKGKLRSIVHDQSASGATLFVEPLGVVELNNEWQELQLAERDEIRRILTELSALVGLHAEQILQLLEALAELDLAVMCAKYAEDLRASEPLLVPIRSRGPDHPGTTIKIYHARHPLLNPATVVPIDVDLDEKTFSLVITGPNTGGKTVTLKTVGLLALMAQTGLHIPAQSGSCLSLFEDIYADIGDEQSIEQSLSTFSGHITNIVRILRKADTHTLVLLDELGAGTDPQEGAALARALLDYLVKRRIPCLVATHYPELKAFAHTTPGVINASMEFDLHSLQPTFHLTIGLPGRSNALLIAERLGLPKDVLETARGGLHPDDLRTEDLLDEIHRQRDLARRARGAADRTHHEAEKLRGELMARLEKIEDERLAVMNQARAEVEKEVEDLRAELEEVRRSLVRARQPLEALKSLQEKLEIAEEAVQRPAERRQLEPVGEKPLQVGEKVYLRSLKLEGVVSGLGESEVEVQLGGLRVRARLNDIQRGGIPLPEPPSGVASSEKPGRRLRKTSGTGPSSRMASALTSPSAAGQPSPGMELDLRGQRAEDALEMLERYIDSAYLSGMPFVRIIHGKGTGRLRQVVREALRASPHIQRFETGLEGEGGDGVTVAHLEPEQ